jgi:hypothetical protein
MLRIAELREEIYIYFHNSESCQQFFYDSENEERFCAYAISMYLLQDTTESLYAHREKGFSSDLWEAYIEFWGVMQALIIQQDSIKELYEAVIGSPLDTTLFKSWEKVRKVRNLCVGHPAKKDIPKKYPITRTCMSRKFGNYKEITYREWQCKYGIAGITHRKEKLGALIDDYAKEAESILLKVLQSMKQQWQ